MNIIVDLRALVGSSVSGVSVYLHETLTELLRLDRKNNYFLWWNSAQRIPPPHFDFLNARATFVITHYSNRILNARLLTQKKPWLDRLILTTAGRQHTRANLFWLPDPRPVALSPDCQLVTTIHDLSAELYPQFFSFKTRVWHWLISARKLAKNSTCVLTVSDLTSRQIQKFWHISRTKIRVTSLGVRDDFQRVTDQKVLMRVRRRYRLPKRFILSLGTLEPRKNLDTLVYAFAKLKQETDLPHTLVFAGSANPEIFADHPFKNQKLNLKNSQLIGHIAEADKAALYSLADCFCFPSFYEGFGLPVLEALKIGTPLVASDLPTTREIARNAALLLPPKNIEVWSFALRNVLTNSALRMKLIHTGKKETTHFTWRETARQTLDVFEKVSLRGLR